jgi:hypothetical protein
MIVSSRALSALGQLTSKFDTRDTLISSDVCHHNVAMGLFAFPQKSAFGQLRFESRSLKRPIKIDANGH